MHPLPQRVVVDLDILDRSRRNITLAERFLAGVREAGIAVGRDPTILLHVTTSRFSEVAGRASGGAELSYSDLRGLPSGGVRPVLPASPGNRFAAPHSPSPVPLLSVRVDATEGKGSRVTWVASLQCSATGSDDGLLAQELGRVIGSTLGQGVERRPF